MKEEEEEAYEEGEKGVECENEAKHVEETR